MSAAGGLIINHLSAIEGTVNPPLILTEPDSDTHNYLATNYIPISIIGNKKSNIRKPTSKRSKVPPYRAQLLESEGSVYLVSCSGEAYDCFGHEKEGCQRGFFSLFIQVVYSYKFAEQYQISVYIDFSNTTYSYSTTAANKGIPNFWDRYFIQAWPETFTRVLNHKIENFPLRIWDRNLFRELNTLLRVNMLYREIVKERFEVIASKFQQKKILGVHIRRTDHPSEVQPVPLNKYLKSVKKLERDYDQIFLATDDSQVLDIFQDHFGNRLTFNDVNRSHGLQPIHSKFARNPEIDLVMEALMDCYSLSQCSRVVLSPSNLSYSALILNPELKYELIESNPAKWSRWKTLILYHLDKWGIRKW